jgi:thiamine-monophosphate kinase
MSTLSDIGEFGLIRHIRELIEEEGVEGIGTIAGAGDDTAAFEPRPGHAILVTCDAMVEGRHYLRTFMNQVEVGRRAMAMNISDIGAMGGQPRWALVSLGLPEDMDIKDVTELYRGFLMELNPLDAVILGGNITKSDYGLLIDITLIGEVERGNMVRRSGAKPGDAILVTGYPGQAAAGLEILSSKLYSDSPEVRPLLDSYRTPPHRAMIGWAAARTGAVTAMIDISDGFLGDLAHIGEESGVGAEVIEKDLPVSEALLWIAEKWRKNPRKIVLEASDDYELILTCNPSDVETVRAAVAKVSDVLITEVGKITDAAGQFEVIQPDKSRTAVIGGGWDHFYRP